MKIVKLGPPENFENFLRRTLGVEVVAYERRRSLREEMRLPRWHASAKGLEIMDRGFLTSSAGNGNTPEDALRDYARILAGKRVVVNAYRNDRIEVQCPDEWTFE